MQNHFFPGWSYIKIVWSRVRYNLHLSCNVEIGCNPETMYWRIAGFLTTNLAQDASQYKDASQYTGTVFTRTWISIIKIRWSHEHFIFIMGIHVPWKCHHYVETDPCSLNNELGPSGETLQLFSQWIWTHLLPNDIHYTVLQLSG